MLPPGAARPTSLDRVGPHVDFAEVVGRADYGRKGTCAAALRMIAERHARVLVEAGPTVTRELYAAELIDTCSITALYGDVCAECVGEEMSFIPPPGAVLKKKFSTRTINDDGSELMWNILSLAV